MPYKTIDVAIEDWIATITLNRPDAMNAFTVEMANELIDAFESAGSNDDVRAIIVTGAGRAFCAGMDLSRSGNVFGLDGDLNPTLDDLKTRADDPDIKNGVRDTGGRVALAIYDCPKPIIAAINGAAVGIGATMTLPMDIRLASDKARIGFVFNKIGITPEACSTWFLPRLVGMGKALEWCYTGEILTAEKAHASGLVSEVLAPDDLLPAARKIAEMIARERSPVAIAMTRQMMYRNSAAAHPRDAHNVESLAIFHESQHDGQEGIKAFLEKRTPEFSATVNKDMPPFYPWWDDQ